MKELSIFVDESGDFGEYNHRTPYYIISMVLHDQKIDITENFRLLKRWKNFALTSLKRGKQDNKERNHGVLS